MSFLSKITRAFFLPPSPQKANGWKMKARAERENVKLPSPQKTGDWKIAGCSQAGTAHLRRGRSCEDAADWFVRGELLGIIVADGAGSAAHPALGSALAVRTAHQNLLEHLSNTGPITVRNARNILSRVYQKTLNTLGDRAYKMGVDPSELACTLIIVVATRTFVTAAQVGDGAVVLQADDGSFTALTTPTNGDYANETILLGCTPTTDVQIVSEPEFSTKSIAVFSDGLQRLALKMPQGIPHEPFFRPLFDQLANLTESEMEKILKEFLASPRVNARTDDDKSLVIAQFL